MMVTHCHSLSSRWRSCRSSHRIWGVCTCIAYGAALHTVVSQLVLVISWLHALKPDVQVNFLFKPADEDDLNANCPGDTAADHDWAEEREQISLILQNSILVVKIVDTSTISNKEKYLACLTWCLELFAVPSNHESKFVISLYIFFFLLLNITSVLMATVVMNHVWFINMYLLFTFVFSRWKDMPCECCPFTDIKIIVLPQRFRKENFGLY